MFDRQIEFRGQAFTERSDSKTRTVLCSPGSQAPVLGTIANEIEGLDDRLSLRFSFALIVQGVEGGRRGRDASGVLREGHTDDAVVVFGNNPPAVGRPAIAEANGGFWSMIGGLRHERRDLRFVDGGDTAVSEVLTQYTTNAAAATLADAAAMGLRGNGAVTTGASPAAAVARMHVLACCSWRPVNRSVWRRRRGSTSSACCQAGVSKRWCNGLTLTAPRARLAE